MRARKRVRGVKGDGRRLGVAGTVGNGEELKARLKQPAVCLKFGSFSVRLLVSLQRSVPLEGGQPRGFGGLLRDHSDIQDFLPFPLGAEVLCVLLV